MEQNYKFGEIKQVNKLQYGYFIKNKKKYIIKKEGTRFFVKSVKGKKWWIKNFNNLSDTKNAIENKLRQVYKSWQTKHKNNSYVVWNKGLTIETNEKLKKSIEKATKTKKILYAAGIIAPWNKGLNKNTNEKLKVLSENRKGRKNPMHKSRGFWKSSSDEKIKKYKKKMSKSGKIKMAHLTGKTIFERYGKERGMEILQKMKKAQQNREFEPHKGHKHSPETIQRFRENTSRMHAEGKYPQTDTKPMREFFKILKEYKVDSLFKKEYCDFVYSIDYAIPQKKIAFEIDGDYWHCNPKIYPDGPKYDMQKKNIRIQRAKTAYLTNRGWKIYRFWESDILNNKESIVKKLKAIFKENNIILWNF